MKIREVTLTIEWLEDVTRFYRDVLRLPVVSASGQTEVTVGSSRLILKAAAPFRGSI